MKHRPYGPYEAFVKPVLGWLLALVFVALFWWLYIILAILVRTKLGSPVLFTQDRPGRMDKRTGQEKIFKLYKFRTMKDALDKDGNPLPDEDRMTSFGSKLRSTSLDELPEILFNILIFRDMAWIGPRPLLVKYLPRYSATQRRRHEVKPGLTGNAQAHGRNAISWSQKFALDVEYVDHITFVTDIKIIFDTIGALFKREGINSENSVTMEEFLGDN